MTRMGHGLRLLAAAGWVSGLLLAGVPAAMADGNLTVFAAASLKNALDAVNAACEAEVG